MTKKKEDYEKPQMQSEDMELYGMTGGGGGTCNGTQNGGRKSDTVGPPACDAAKLAT